MEEAVKEQDVHILSNHSTSQVGSHNPQYCTVIFPFFHQISDVTWIRSFLSPDFRCNSRIHSQTGNFSCINQHNFCCTKVDGLFNGGFEQQFNAVYSYLSQLLLNLCQWQTLLYWSVDGLFRVGFQGQCNILQTYLFCTKLHTDISLVFYSVK